MVARSLTTPQTWTVSQLVEALDENCPGISLQLPRFQRAQVWGRPDQRALIRSIHEGHPIGSLLLFETPDSGTQKTYLLVDGLQRTTAIRDYHLAPLAYIEWATLPSAERDDIRDAICAALEDYRELEEDDVERAVVRWMRDTEQLKAARGFDSWGFLKSVAATLEVEADLLRTDAVLTALGYFTDAVKIHSDISSYSLPVIVYAGGEGELPDIFEKINARGTKLNKYEVFAATWVSQQTQVTSQNIRDAVYQKYADILEQGFKIPGLTNGEIEQYSLFEYLFGLGKVLASDYPLLFGNSDDPTSIESFGFTLATVIHGMRLAEMKSLPGRMLRGSDDFITPELFETALRDGVSFINTTLKPYVELKLNSSSGEATIAHTEYQIASLISRVVVGRFNTRTWEERPGWQEERNQILAHTIPQHYLYDVVQQNWRGSGDSRLYNCVWDESKEGAPPKPSAFYLRPVTRQEWDRTFEDWFEKQRLYEQRSRSNIKGVDKLFLKYVYCNIVTAMEERQHTFEIDHLFPVKRLVDLITEEEAGWPISSVANLALFDWQTNREKTKLTISEYVEKLDPADREEKLQMLNRYLLCAVDDVSIPRDSGWGRDHYLQFLKTRFAAMCDQVYSVLHIDANDTVLEAAAAYESHG